MQRQPWNSVPCSLSSRVLHAMSWHFVLQHCTSCFLALGHSQGRSLSAVRALGRDPLSMQCATLLHLCQSTRWSVKQHFALALVEPWLSLAVHCAFLQLSRIRSLACVLAAFLVRAMSHSSKQALDNLTQEQRQAEAIFLAIAMMTKAPSPSNTPAPSDAMPSTAPAPFWIFRPRQRQQPPLALHRPRMRRRHTRTLRPCRSTWSCSWTTSLVAHRRRWYCCSQFLRMLQHA